MKIFAIYTNLILTKKPDWLDKFRQKYDKSYDFHITLKQPCFIEEEKVPGLRQQVSSFFNSTHTQNHKIEIIFDDVLTDKGDDGVTVMVRAQNNPALVSLQKDLRSFLKDYDNYVKPKYKSYEENFEPHITIARNLSEDQFGEALMFLNGNIQCEGEISRIILSILNEITPEEARNPLSQTLYIL
jgi:2'-5' RNA ligase